MANEHLVKTDNPEYMKDEKSGALVSTDLVAFKKFKLQQQQSEKIKNQENDLNNIKSDISELKDEMGEIKDLLKQFLTK